METDINAALTGSDAVTVEWTGTEYKIMSNTGTSSGSITLSNPGSGLASLNLMDSSNKSASSSWVGNDTSTLANATGKKFTVTTGTNDNMTVQVGSGTATEITIAAGTYTSNANLVTAINTALSNASIAATAIWTGSAYAFKDSGNVGNITISSVDASLDSHMKISANYLSLIHI